MLHSCDITLQGSVDIEVTTSYRDYAQTVNWLMFWTVFLGRVFVLCCWSVFLCCVFCAVFMGCVFGPCVWVVFLFCVFGLCFSVVFLGCVVEVCIWAVFLCCAFRLCF